MPDYRQWCQNTFNMLATGGMWGVPRSGLVFRRDPDALVLIAPESPDADQLEDYDCIRSHFAEAGITVRR